MNREIVWERTGPMGLEHLVLSAGSDRVDADGVVVIDTGGGDVVRLRYAIRLGPDWRTRSAELALDRGGPARTLSIARTGERWSVDGVARSDLDGAFDIDIAGTPFTNAMPLRRLALVPGVPAPIRVVYVGLPALNVAPAEQDYTRLGEGRFRYRGLGTGFEAVITADADGIVVDYPPIWRRRAGRPS
ncbi:hypothetical protein STVA_05280 [Allostella vacuolata]|nr:hypothetical protein STVA_05280 [Stella vacuolata]